MSKQTNNPEKTEVRDGVIGCFFLILIVLGGSYYCSGQKELKLSYAIPNYDAEFANEIDKMMEQYYPPSTVFGFDQGPNDQLGFWGLEENDITFTRYRTQVEKVDRKDILFIVFEDFSITFDIFQYVLQKEMVEAIKQNPRRVISTFTCVDTHIGVVPWVLLGVVEELTYDPKTRKVTRNSKQNFVEKDLGNYLIHVKSDRSRELITCLIVFQEEPLFTEFEEISRSLLPYLTNYNAQIIFKAYSGNKENPLSWGEVYGSDKKHMTLTWN